MKPAFSSKEVTKLLTDIILPFYEVRRDMVVNLTGDRRFENDAEHSWALTMLAVVLTPKLDPKLDMARVCQIAAVHDLVEIFAGDTTLFGTEEKLASKDARETKARKKLAKYFTSAPWVLKLVDEYSDKSSLEARYVSALDKYLAYATRNLDASRFYKEMNMTKKFYDARMISHRKKAQSHPGVYAMYKELDAFIDAHPEFFAPEI